MTDVLEPPAYDGFGFEALVRSSQDLSDLPAYTRRPTPPPVAQAEGPREFTYHIKKSNVPWATLTVQGDRRLTKLIPTILEGSNITGSVKLALQSAEAIQAICIVVKGEIINGARAALPSTVFLESKHTLWTAAQGDPNASGTPDKTSSLKLKGNYHWPFSIALPQTVTKSGKTYNLPHTFLDRLATFSIRYTAEMRIVRSMLRQDDKMPCVFAFFSMRQPDPPSALRMLAYQENSPLLGPEADPEGWHTETLSVKGTIFSSRMIDVKCMFSLANPLSYTRSASIPCAMTIESRDKQALDLLSAPTASIVCLDRTFKEDSPSFQRAVEHCGQAVFWSSTEGDATESTTKRHLMGEIHLKSNLQPSSSVCGFAVEYAVVVFPFQAAGFKPLDAQKPLSRQTVEITTRYAPGPRPKMYSPPAYEGRNVIVDQYYYQLVMQNTIAGGRSRVRGR